jgi:quinol monooxygenase YgiN
LALSYPIYTTTTHPLLLVRHYLPLPMSLSSQLESISRLMKDERDLKNCEFSIVLRFVSTFTLLVFYRFGEFATWIRQNEPGTLSYELAQSDTDQLEILITERYVNKVAYSEAHRTSSKFLEFKKAITDMNSESNRETLGWSLHGQSYNELNIGFM